MDAARLAFVRADEAWRASLELVAGADARLVRAARAYVADTHGMLDAEKLRRHRNWIDASESHAAALRRDGDRCRRARDIAAGALQQASKDVKVLERLRDRAWQRHLVEERQAEMKDHNELATQRYAQRRAARSR